MTSRSERLVEAFTLKYGRLPTEVDPDYLEMLRMSKYRVIPIPDFKPHKCANCGSTKTGDRQYVDFGLEIEWFGIVYLCTLCLEDIAKTVGLFTKYEQEVAQSLAAIEAARSLQVDGDALEVKVLHIFEEVKEYFDRLHSDRDNSNLIAPPGVGISKESPEPVITQPEPATVASKPRTLRSTSGTRSTNIPSLKELLDRG